MHKTRQELQIGLGFFLQHKRCNCCKHCWTSNIYRQDNLHMLLKQQMDQVVVLTWISRLHNTQVDLLWINHSWKTKNPRYCHTMCDWNHFPWTLLERENKIHGYLIVRKKNTQKVIATTNFLMVGKRNDTYYLPCWWRHLHSMWRDHCWMLLRSITLK